MIGTLPSWWTVRRSDTLILCYHAVSARWPADLAVTVDEFGEQLRWLVAHGYRGVTFSEAVRERAAGPTVAITFDDGYRSVLEHAAPLMASLGLPGTAYVVTDFVDSGRTLTWPGIDRWVSGVHDSELRAMSWPELRQLEQGGWEVGSHTLTHPRLTSLDDDALARELGESRAACERKLGHPVASIAYPYGDVDSRVVNAAAAAGYTSGAALPSVMGPCGALEWPRVAIYRPDSMSRFALKVSPVVRRLRTALAPAERTLRGLRARHT